MQPFAKWNTAAAAILLAASLTACSSPEAPPGASLPAVTPETNLQQPSAAESSSPALTQPSAANSNEPEATPAPQQTAKLFRMNDVYRFVPIDNDELKKSVLLTFDDGPHNKEIITSLLDTLDKHKAKAIFFVNGYRVKQNPELLQLIHERGQTIGNHSWDHINLKQEEKDVIEQQIGDVQSKVEELTGAKPLFFRPPFGSGSDAVREITKNHGMLYMTWSNGSLDWDKSTKDKPEAVIQNVLEQLHPGANILMHELKWTADALDELLTALEEKGYSFIDPDTIEGIN